MLRNLACWWSDPSFRWLRDLLDGFVLFAFPFMFFQWLVILFHFFYSQFPPFLVFILQKNLIVNLIKIQNDGTVEVDLPKNSPVASELLELSSIEGPSFDLDDTLFYETTKSIPRLNIAILVVGTRGDVQPFLAMAKRLQVCLTLFIYSPCCTYLLCNPF